MSLTQPISYLQVQGNYAVLCVTRIYKNGPQMNYMYWINEGYNVVSSKFWSAMINIHCKIKAVLARKIAKIIFWMSRQNSRNCKARNYCF